MLRSKIILLWIIFVFFIPGAYLIIKIFIFPNLDKLDYILILSSYLFAIITFMYRIDERFYFFLNSIKQWFFGSHTSWIFSTRYNNILDYDKFINLLFNEFKQKNFKINIHERDFISFHWQARHILFFRIDQDFNKEYSLHFYTSTIDVPFRYTNRKIKEIFQIFETIENKINMVDRSKKIYGIELVYNSRSPYYSYWVKTLPSEKILNFDCTIRDNENGVFHVKKDKIIYKTFSLQDMFSKIEKYLNLRGI